MIFFQATSYSVLEKLFRLYLLTIKNLMKEQTYIKLILSHIFIGFLVFLFPIFAKIYWLSILFIGLYFGKIDIRGEEPLPVAFDIRPDENDIAIFILSNIFGAAE